jgi:phosphomannomutase
LTGKCFYSTASHLPYNRNGFKFFTNSGGLGKSDISDILARAAKFYDSFKLDTLGEFKADSLKRANFMDQYSLTLAEAVRKGSGGLGKLIAAY